MRRRILLTFLAAAAAVWAQGQPQAQASNMRAEKPTPLPPGLAGVGIQQKLNDLIPLDLVFRDESGRAVPLASFFGKKPVLLALVYYQCPMLCTQILNGVEISLKAVKLNPGRDFEVVVVSFDPSDTPELASAKKATYLRRYGRPDTPTAGTSSPETSRTSSASPMPSVSATATTSPTSSSRMPAASSSPPRRRASRTISTVWSTRRATSGWRWWRLPKRRSATRWTPSCSTATTTIRHWRSTAP